MRNIGDRPDVGRNVFASRPIPARCAEHEIAALVSERAAQAIDLRLGREHDRLIRREVQEAPDSRDKLIDVLVRESVVEAEHRPRMRDLGERAGRRGAQTL